MLVEDDHRPRCCGTESLAAGRLAARAGPTRSATVSDLDGGVLGRGLSFQLDKGEVSGLPGWRFRVRGDAVPVVRRAEGAAGRSSAGGRERSRSAISYRIERWS